MFSQGHHLERWGKHFLLLLLLLLLLGFWFKVSVGFVGITLVALVLSWLRWYFVGSVGIFVGCYPFAKC